MRNVAAGAAVIVMLTAAACTATPAPTPHPSASVTTTPSRLTPANVPAPAAEQVTGQAVGVPAYTALTRGTPVIYPSLSFSGPVTTTARNVRVNSRSADGSFIFTTPKGKLSLRYTTAHAGVKIPVSPPGAPRCIFSQVAAAGDYTVTGGTGSFAGASGHGTWGITYITANVSAHPGKPCGPAGPGAPVPAAAQVMFTASGPLSLG